jgi:hypothetical protein
MKDHGIFTSSSHFWIHLHPLDPEAVAGAVYWYRVEAMCKHIELTKPPLVLGFSKDPARSASGAGFLVPKTTFFVNRAILKPQYCQSFDWENCTDREKGQRGEQIIAALIDHGVIQLMRQVSTSAREADEQFSGVDGWVTWQKKVKFEGKTETYRSANLFVQAREGGHRPNYTVDGLRRVTELLPLFKGREP